MDSCSAIWEKTVDVLKDELSQMSFESWIKPIRPISISGNEITLCVPNSAIKDMLTQRYGEIVISTLRSVTLSKELYPSYVLEKDLQPKTDSDKRINTQLNAKYTFSSFVVGKSNQLARAASIGVAESPGKRYNPLFLYSGTGLGKTHLMHAIGNYILEHNPSANVMYVTSERFTNDLILSIQTGRNTEFREKYRGVDVLLLDDIQFIADKDRTQEEFFHTFNTLYESGKQIVMTSDKPPKEIQSLEERLLSRFEWGLIADILPPDYETRVAILLRKASMEGIQINDPAVLDYIANRAESNIRELEGSLTRVMAYSALTGEPITLKLSEIALKDYYPREKKRVITPATIQEAVCSHFGLSAEELTSKRRSRDIAKPRQIAMYLACSLTNVPLMKIGAYFGKRDHTTVMHARDTITDEIENDPAVKQSVEDIIKRLTE